MRIILTANSKVVSDLLSLRQDIHLVQGPLVKDQCEIAIIEGDHFDLTLHREFILLFDSQKGQSKWSRQLLGATEYCLAIVDLSWGHELIELALSSAIARRERLIAQERTLVDITNEVEVGLNRVRKIHSKMVPVRKDHFHPLTMLSKFVAGKAAGSNYFDLISSGDEILVLMSEANSYLCSAVIMNQLEYLRLGTPLDLDELQRILANILKGLDEVDPKAVEKLSITACLINRKTLRVRGYSFGKSFIQRVGENEQLICANEQNLSTILSDNSKLMFDFNLDRGERVILFSSSFKGKVFWNTIDSMGDSGTIINEVFTWFSRKHNDPFLERDATAILIEVSANAIVQV